MEDELVAFVSDSAGLNGADVVVANVELEAKLLHATEEITALKAEAEEYKKIAEHQQAKHIEDTMQAEKVLQDVEHALNEANAEAADKKEMEMLRLSNDHAHELRVKEEAHQQEVTTLIEHQWRQRGLLTMLAFFRSSRVCAVQRSLHRWLSAAKCDAVSTLNRKTQV